jgi:hypothetical protein
MSFLCNWHLRTLKRSDHDHAYYNPHKYGFETVSSANLFWQLLSFTLIVLTV